jgi:predicted glutamine amidotransferase
MIKALWQLASMTKIKSHKRFKSDTDYYHLKYTKENGQVVVASSGWNQDGWEEIPNGSVLVVDRVGIKSEVFLA